LGAPIVHINATTTIIAMDSITDKTKPFFLLFIDLSSWFVKHISAMNHPIASSARGKLPKPLWSCRTSLPELVSLEGTGY
jgi:hypothetical protein